MSSQNGEGYPGNICMNTLPTAEDPETQRVTMVHRSLSSLTTFSVPNMSPVLPKWCGHCMPIAFPLHAYVSSWRFESGSNRRANLLWFSMANQVLDITATSLVIHVARTTSSHDRRHFTNTKFELRFCSLVNIVSLVKCAEQFYVYPIGTGKWARKRT